MAMKRKFDVVADEEVTQYTGKKQLKLVPFPSTYQPECMDVDVPSMHHVRLPSSASDTSSSGSSSPTSAYPEFNLYAQPHPLHPARSAVSVGLLQPSISPNFQHQTHGCTQIPKLRVSCEAGPNGARSMWAFCEQCGAIEVVDS